MATRKKAEKNQKDNLDQKSQKDNLSQKNPDNLRLKNQKDLVQQQFQENLQQTLEYPHGIKDHWSWIQTLEYPHGIWEHQRRMLRTLIPAPCTRSTGSTQMISPLTVKWG